MEKHHVAQDAFGVQHARQEITAEFAVQFGSPCHRMHAVCTQVERQQVFRQLTAAEVFGSVEGPGCPTRLSLENIVHAFILQLHGF